MSTPPSILVPMKWIAAALLLCGTAFGAAGIDLSGAWSGTIEVNDSSTSVRLRLDQKGGDVTGKIGRAGDSDQVVIRNARIDGNRLTFEASSPETSGPIQFVLVVDGDRMEGDMR